MERYPSKFMETEAKGLVRQLGRQILNQLQLILKMGKK